MHNYYFQRDINVERFLQLLRTESTDVISLDYLMTKANNDQEKYLWRRVKENRKRHYDQLKSLYMYMTNQGPEVEQKIYNLPQSYEEGIESHLKQHEDRLIKLEQTFQDATDPQIRQTLQVIINQFRYEGSFIK